MLKAAAACGILGLEQMTQPQTPRLPEPKIRILILPSWYSTTTRPVSGIFVQQQADCLSKTHEVRVLYLDILQRRETRAPRRYIRQERGYIEEIIEVPNRPLLWQFSYLRRLRKAIAALRGQFDADIVHCHVAVPAGWGAVMLRAMGLFPKIPIVLTEHSSDVRSWLGRPGLRWMARQAFARADVVIAVSDGQKQRIKQAFPKTKDFSVIPNMVDTSRFVPTLMPPVQGNAYRLLFVGLMDTPQKGIPVLLDALVHIKEHTALTIHTDLIGDGALRTQYEAQAARLGLQEGVTFHGYKPPEAIAQYLLECHAFVLPSLHESQGVVVIEALVSGRPAVSTRCGGPEFLIDGSNGLIVGPGEPMPLAKAIIDVLSHLERYDPQQISADAVKRFSCEAVSAQLSALYSREAAARDR